MVSEQKRQMLKHYNEGLSLYKTRKFKEALNVFEKALEYEPGDGPTKLYISRCKELIKNPPPLDWDGVYTMTTK
jgi:tetratricopeptide (TPR) repeat protein